MSSLLVTRVCVHVSQVCIATNTSSKNNKIEHPLPENLGKFQPVNQNYWYVGSTWWDYEKKCTDFMSYQIKIGRVSTTFEFILT